MSERGLNALELGKGKPVDNRESKENQDIHVWDEDDVDSVKVKLTLYLFAEL